MNSFLIAVVVILSILLLMCLIRAIIGPKIADRIVSVNMMGTITIVIIAILTVLLDEGYLADICIIVPQNETFRIEELHLPVYHALCLEIEEAFWKE